MGFLSPALLALAAAIAVPILLHLLQRQHGPRVVFPALRYLRRAERENARRIKLRQLLLLALRTAALALLALAAARPVLRQPGGVHEPTAAVIILDNSLSSGVVQEDRRLLDDLKARAMETLARANAEDRFWILRAGSPWEPSAPLAATEAAEVVRRTEVVAGAADIGASLERARALLAAGADGRAAEIHLLTDLQATGFATHPAADDDAPPILVWTPADAPPANAGVAAVEVGGGLPPRAGERSSLAARIAGDGARDTASLRLTIDHRVIAASDAPAEAATVLPFPARTAGYVPGWVELDPDALRGDDRRYFVVNVQPPPTVALTRPMPFVDEALDVLEEAGRLRRGAPQSADIVVAPGGTGADAARGGRTAVVIAPESPLELPAANRRLADAGVPWRFTPTAAEGEARLVIDRIGEELADALAETRIRQSYGLERQGVEGRDSVLLRLRDGSPWVVRGELASGGRYLVIGSPLTAEASTLPTSAGLIPLLDRMIGAWAATATERTEAAPGEGIVLPVGATVVERPDGGRETVTGGAEYRVPGEPGVYRVFGDGGLVGAFAVNPPASESRLERLDERELAAALPGWRVTRVDDAEDWADVVFQERLGREAWRPFLFVALAVLLVEGLLAAVGRGTARPTTESSAPAPAEASPAVGHRHRQIS